MSSQWIRVAPSELASDLSQTTVEIELDSDGTLRLSELRSQFPGATGLRYRNPKTGNLRAVKQFCLNQDSISNDSITSSKTISNSNSSLTEIINNDPIQINSQTIGNSTKNQTNTKNSDHLILASSSDSSQNPNKLYPPNSHKSESNSKNNSKIQHESEIKNTNKSKNVHNIIPESSTSPISPHKEVRQDIILKAPEGGPLWPDYLYFVVGKDYDTNLPLAGVQNPNNAENSVQNQSNLINKAAVLSSKSENVGDLLSRKDKTNKQSKEKNNSNRQRNNNNNNDNHIKNDEKTSVLSPNERDSANLSLFNRFLDPSISGRLTTTNHGQKSSGANIKQCSDLIVLGLPWKANEQTLTDYFKSFGALVMVQVKRDSKTSKSRGYGFIRYQSYESQKKVLSQKHQIENRTCDVKLPHSKVGDETNRKIFVGRITQDLTKEIIKEYFGRYGEVFDVFIPSPFRAFAFVTFEDAAIAESLLNEDHLINGVSVYTSNAEPKNSEKQQALQQQLNLQQINQHNQIKGLLGQNTDLSQVGLIGSLAANNSSNNLKESGGINKNSVNNNPNQSLGSPSSRYTTNNNSQLHSTTQNTSSSLTSAKINQAIATLTQGGNDSEAGSLSTPPYGFG